MGIKIAESNEVTKKKYRLGYDYLFLPRESISYKNDLIRGSTEIHVILVHRLYFISII